MTIVHPYNRKALDALSKENSTTIEGKSMTKQSHKDECDVNKIMAKFQRDGAMTHVNTRQPQYGDATALDFKAAMDLITSSTELFQALPSELRNAFKNDPASFLDYVNNPENKEDVDAGFPSLLTPQVSEASVQSQAEPASAAQPQESGEATP